MKQFEVKRYCPTPVITESGEKIVSCVVCSKCGQCQRSPIPVKSYAVTPSMSARMAGVSL